ncbi:MAG: TraB/GumN family protein, partial [Chthoniobacterales bacterium]
FYLVGTIHTLRVNDYPLAQVYGQTLRDSKRLLFEYNPKEDALYTKKFHDAGQYPPGQDIRSSIRRETLDLLLRNLTAFHLSFEEIKQYKPWALAYRLWSIRGYAAAAKVQSVDGYLAYHAQRLGKEVAGLETVDEHVAFWENTLQLDGERLLVETLVRGKRLNDRFDETRVAWKKGDLAALSATNAGLRDVDLSTSQRLLDRRNAKWLARIESEMKTGKATAIVAGTAHFVGPDSVVDLLRKRGYKIEQL